MSNIKSYIGKEVRINGREGEIVGIRGVQFLKINFFNLNDGECIIDTNNIEKYLL